MSSGARTTSERPREHSALAGGVSGAPVALYSDPDGQAAAGRALLERAGLRVLVEDLRSERELIERVAATQPAALLITYLPVTEAVLAAAPSLRIVSCSSVGFDHVDLAAAERHGVWVCNVPDAATEEVASHALAMALALVRGLPLLDREVRRGGWDYEVAGVLPRLSATTLGILGLGRIGRRLAGLADGIFGRVVGFDPLVPETDWPPGVERAERLEDCLTAARVLSLHLPLAAATERIVDRDALRRLGPRGYLVNVSRGGLVDQAALLESLRHGDLAAAALDVTDPEPPPADSPLRDHPRILITPHAAWWSAEAYEAYEVRQADNVVAWWREGRPRTPVNRVEDRAEAGA